MDDDDDDDDNDDNDDDNDALFEQQHGAPLPICTHLFLLT